MRASTQRLPRRGALLPAVQGLETQLEALGASPALPLGPKAHLHPVPATGTVLWILNMEGGCEGQCYNSSAPPHSRTH